MECNVCHQQFRSVAAVSTHKRYMHGTIHKYICPICNQIFNTRANFANHRKEHAEFRSATCPLCKEQMLPKELLPHISDSHGINVETEKMSFGCPEDFQKWKSKMEEETRSLFIVARGEKPTTGGSLKTYVCHRKGHYVPRGEDKRHLKVIGSNKINGNCPAKLIVRSSAEGVKVSFTKTHVGHSCDLDRLYLTKDEKDAIAQKIAAKIPLEEVLDDIRESLYDGRLSRQHLVTKKDLYNICQSYNLNKVTLHQSDKNDCINLDDWVRKMSESKNLVRGCKPQGKNDSKYPELKESDFFLIIANDTQIEMLRSFGNDCVCIDSTHGLNAYDVELYTIMVLDDMHRAFPCAFLFSNRSDKIVLETFFKSILNALGSPIEPKIFMSDISEIFYSAWCSVMPHENSKRLHCTWHILRAWKNNLNRIKGKDKQIEVFHQLVVLLEELDANTFDEMKMLLLSEWRNNEDTRDFAKYIEHFFNNPSFWAHCFRLNSSLNANMALESLQKVVTYLYLKGKKGKRLDLGINALTRFLKDKIYDRSIATLRGEISHKLADFQSRHKAAMNLSTHYVLEYNGVWKVPSSRDSFEFYDVTVNKEDCSCNIRCNECNACVHYLSCSCLDNSLKWNMCKHSHLVALILKQRREGDEGDGSNTSPLPADSSGAQAQSEFVAQDVPETTEKSFEQAKRELQSKMMRCFDLVMNREELETLEKLLVPAEQTLLSLKEQRNRVPPPQTLPPLTELISPHSNLCPTEKKRRLDPTRSNSLGRNTPE